MEQALFALEDFKFTKVNMDLTEIGSDINIELVPSGCFNRESKHYNLTFLFNATKQNESSNFISIECNAVFKFKNVTNFEDIPDFFFPNSIAIVFPYVRAFISSVTIQANIQPIILPTYNLNSLKDELKQKTTIQN